MAIVIDGVKLCNADPCDCEFSCESKIGKCKDYNNMTRNRIVGDITGLSKRNCAASSDNNCGGSITFHHFFPSKYRSLRKETHAIDHIPIEKINTGVYLCWEHHKKVHRSKTNDQLFSQGITNKEKIIELLHKVISNERA